MITVHSLLDSLSAADWAKAVLAAHQAADEALAEGLKVFKIPTPRVPKGAIEMHVFRTVYADGRKELGSLQSPASEGDDHWHPADVARPGEWWHRWDWVTDGEDPSTRVTYVARVRRIDGPGELWVEVPAVPLEGYAGELPHAADATVSA